jgi:hypothetical protein
MTDNSDTDSTQSGQPQDGQPSDAQAQGGQPRDGQPQGGQPAGGQPASGQPQGGQPTQGQVPQSGQPTQGGQPQGQSRQPVQTGPAVTDIIDREDTKEQIKIGIATFALLGLGAGIGMMGIGISFDTGFGSLATLGLFALPIALVAPTSFLVATKIDSELVDVPDELVYATACTATGVGGFLQYLIAWFLAGIALGDIPLGDLFIPMIMTGLGGAVIAAGVVWMSRNFGGPQQPQEQTVPPRQ